MLASANRLSVAEWEAELLQRRTLEAERPDADRQAALRRQFYTLSQRSKAQNRSPHLGRTGIPALNALRKTPLELMLLAHQELAALERADQPTVPVECLERLLQEIGDGLAKLDDCLNAICAARLTAELVGPTVAELARGRELPLRRFRPALDQLLAQETCIDLSALAPLSALGWTEPDVAPSPVPAWFWATAVPAARWTAAMTRDSLRTTPRLREAQVLAALLMDVGQIVISAGQRRSRSGSAVPSDHRHPEVSAAVIAGIQDAAAETSIWAGQHHERMDGSGFPRKLTRGQLCFAARTVSAVARWTELLQATARATPPLEALFGAAVVLWKETLAGGFDEAVVRELLAAVRPDLPAAVQRGFLQGAWLKRDGAHAALAGPHRIFGNDSTDEFALATASQNNEQAVP